VAQLGGAFLSLGALCTVQSASDIALAPMQRLMGAFHAALAEGASPAEALRRARVALGEDRAYAHPFYTMSMRVVGLGLEPIVKR
jgi:CHAT domain-containing protein